MKLTRVKIIKRFKKYIKSKRLWEKKSPVIHFYYLTTKSYNSCRFWDTFSKWIIFKVSTSFSSFRTFAANNLFGSLQFLFFGFCFTWKLNKKLFLTAKEVPPAPSCSRSYKPSTWKWSSKVAIAWLPWNKQPQI